MKRVIVFVVMMLFASQSFANFKADVDARVGEMPKGPVYTIPYIFWGADMVTFYANGGLETQPGSIFAQQGIQIKLVAGDDFIQQVRDYMAGKLPFLRGTAHMNSGMASEILAMDARTKGVCFMQLSWSTGGDCFVVRGNIKSVQDLKAGMTIVANKNGPHVGFLDDILKLAKLTWNDIKVIWVDDITGAKGPAEYFKKNINVDGCFVVSPDMVGLTGGLTKIGDGRETVKGAKVLVSTAEMNHSIADVYTARKDFYDKNKSFVMKFTAGYFKACEEVIELKKKYEVDPKGSPDYTKLLKMTQDIYGKDAIPTLEDAHGLLSDCTLAGYPGNVAFFTEKNNMHGFDAIQSSALDMGISLGYFSTRNAAAPSGLDYNSEIFTKYLSKIEVKRTEKFRAEIVEGEIEQLTATGGLDDRTISSFTINFEPDQKIFSAAQFKDDFDRVIRESDKVGGAVMTIRGHADPTKVLNDILIAGQVKGIIQRQGSKEQGWTYSCNGRLLDPANTAKMIELVEKGDFDQLDPAQTSMAKQMNPYWAPPRETLQTALNISKERSENVKKEILGYAKAEGVRIDASQVSTFGVGIREPFVTKPRNLTEAKQNMRVEFRLVRVSAEATHASEFDF